MRVPMAVVLLTILFASPPLQAQAKPSASDSAVAGSASGTLVLASAGGRRIAPVCPALSQLRSLVEAKNGKWHKSNIGCGYVLPGNFERAEVLADSGAYLQVRFTRKDEDSTRSWMYEGGLSRILWTPRSRYSTTR